MRPLRRNKQIDCTVPPPTCSPATWSGSPIDTSFDQNKLYYYKITQVNGLNTNDNEYSISNLKNRYFLTKETNNKQSIYNLKKIETDRFEVEDIFLSGNKYNIGLLSPDNVLTIVSADLESKEDDSYTTGYNYILY